MRAVCLILVLASHVLLAATSFAQDAARSGPRDQKAIDDVSAGRRTDANAAWWGFNPDDATDAVQRAVDSKAKTVVIPFVGQPWVLRPIKLRGELELILEPGVILLAKKGEFRGGGDSLLAAYDAENITIRGYGATLRMWKSDYQKPPYERAEWRMGVRIMGCRHVRIEGIRVESTGGDGIYVGSSGEHRWSEDVRIRHCVCHDNHRQGISVTSAQDLVVDNCILSHTRGTPPEAGIDFEPDSADERLVNCLVRNCVFEHNAGHAILIYMKPLTRESEPVSIRFENCLSRMGSLGQAPADLTDPAMAGWSGMAIGTALDKGPKGLVEFVNCTSINTGKEGAKIFDKSADSVKVRFVNCKWQSSWLARHRDYGGPRVPVLIQVRNPDTVRRTGGVEFVDCRAYDEINGPTLLLDTGSADVPLVDVSGRIVVRNPSGVSARLGNNVANVDLKVENAGK